MLPLSTGSGVVGFGDSYDGQDTNLDHTIPEKALIRCHKSGLYFEKELMVQRSDGEWVHRGLLDYDPVTGTWE